MIPISRIARLRHPGVFQNVAWPKDLPTFGRYNLIYGWNGSGKTIISRMFRALEMRTPPPSGEVVFSINERDISGNDFPQQAIPVRVFNRDFIEQSIFPVNGGDVPPIFVVGKTSVEKQKEVDRLKDRLSETEDRLITVRAKKKTGEKGYDDFCIDHAKNIKESLRSSGTNRYNNYDKSDFKCRAEKMIKSGDGKTYGLDDQGRDALRAQLRAGRKVEVDELTYRLPDLQALAKTVVDLLSSTVVSAAIQSLKDDPTLALWVYTGLEIHQERQGGKCLFCHQPMPKDRLAALEGHFNTEYKELLQNVDEHITSIQAAIDAEADQAIPQAEKLYDELSSEFESAAAALQGERDSAKRALEELANALANKRGRVFESVLLDAVIPELNITVVDNLNGVIRKHNQECADFQTRIETARGKLEADWVVARLNDFVKFQNATKAAEGEVTEAKNDIQRLGHEITTLEREIVEHRQPAEELNEDLCKYLGHDEVRLEVKDTGYAITRNGVPATDLSEGEMTAIALLYFLKSLKDRNFELAKGVVVLDDPVSSLDSNALYLAFGFIQERTKDAAQLFILTHNFTLFQLARNWFRHLNRRNKKNVRPAQFYMLDFVRHEGQRRSCIRALDPLLEHYESEYHYLFARIYRATKPSGARALEESYIFPNMARRLLEAFLAFRQPHLSGGLWQKLNHSKFDEAKKLRIIRFLHIHSHSNAVGEPEHDPSLLGEADSVLKDLLEFIKSQDPEHYEAMVSLAVPPDKEEDDG